MLDAGIVDENIDGSKALFGIANQLYTLRGIGQIGVVEENLDAVLLAQPPTERFSLLWRGDAVDDETAPGCGKGLRHAEAYARGGSGDDGGRVAKIHAMCVSRAATQRPAKSSMRLATVVAP